jgi:hypothetical protein
VRGVTFVSVVKGMKILTDVIPKNNNGLRWAYVVPTDLFTSLLPTRCVRSVNYRQQSLFLFHVRSKGNVFTELSNQTVGPCLFDVC